MALDFWATLSPLCVVASKNTKVIRIFSLGISKDNAPKLPARIEKKSLTLVDNSGVALGGGHSDDICANICPSPVPLCLMKIAPLQKKVCCF